MLCDFPEADDSRVRSLGRFDHGTCVADRVFRRSTPSTMLRDRLAWAPMCCGVRTGCRIAAAGHAGIRQVRADFDWHDVQPQRDVWHWQDADA